MTTETIDSKYEGNAKWHGIVKGRDNCFYCLPYNAKQILKIDPSNDETTLVGAEYDDNYKWCNGFANEDCVCGIPHTANQFLKYNIITATVIVTERNSNLSQRCQEQREQEEYQKSST